MRKILRAEVVRFQKYKPSLPRITNFWLLIEGNFAAYFVPAVYGHQIKSFKLKKALDLNQQKSSNLNLKFRITWGYCGDHMHTQTDLVVLLLFLCEGMTPLRSCRYSSLPLTASLLTDHFLVGLCFLCWAGLHSLAQFGYSLLSSDCLLAGWCMSFWECLSLGGLLDMLPCSPCLCQVIFPMGMCGGCQLTLGWNLLIDCTD